MLRSVCWLALIFSTSTWAATPGEEFFESKIRPLLVTHCHGCHAGAKDKGGLRLDSRENFLKGGDGGPVAKRIVDAVSYKNPDLQMPPKGKLPDSSIADLSKWIEMGAPWPADAAKAGTDAAKFDLAARKASHWSWKPLESVAAPPVKDASWPKETLDRFLLARLEAEGQPLPPAVEPRALIRRIAFDLTGLPPDPADADAFAADPSDARLASYVNRLLASPAYGERWARHWLDLVRYAETRGHEFDFISPNVHQYRDYVIRALNADVPYDRFVKEHVAGDLLPAQRQNPREGFDESILGTGFWFLGEQVHSPVDLRLDEADRIDNMVDVFGKTFLGLTINCARCHDHKFDALSTKDYYALYAILQSSGYRLVRFDTREREQETARHLAELDAAYAARFQRELNLILKPYAEQLASQPAPEFTDDLAGIDPSNIVIDFGKAKPQDWRVDGPTFGLRPRWFGEVDPGSANPRLVTRPAAYADPLWNALSLANNSENDPGDLGRTVRPGRTIRTPDFVLGSGKLYYLVRGKGVAYSAVQSHAMLEGPLHRRIYQQLNSGDEFRWVEHDLTRYPGHRTRIEFSPISPNFAIAAVIQADAPPTPARLTVAPWNADRIVDALTQYPADPQSARIVNRMLQTIDPPLAAFSEYRDACQALVSEQSWVSRLAPALWDGSGLNARVAIRGNPRTPGAEVPRRMPEAISPQPLRGPGSGRLDLAERMTDPAITPLVPRVAVNRIWHHLMGRGIVATPDDFGVLGERPTDPALLDFLSESFVEQGWSIKSLIRQIVLSQTYRTAPATNRRLQGEAIRDSLLVLGGNFKSHLYGPPVPVYLTPFMEGRGRPGRSGPLDGDGRRSIYGAVRRNFLPPLMLAFDTPMPATTVGRRSVSNVPAQALILLNDPFVRDQSQRWAKRIVAGNSEARDRVEAMYREAFARPPRPEELANCLDFVADQEKALGAPAAWGELAHALVNVKEFIYLP